MWARRQHHWENPLMAGSCLSLQHSEQCPEQVLKNERNNEWMGELWEMGERVRIGRVTVQSGWVVRGMQSTGGEFIVEDDGPFSGSVSSMWTEMWLRFSKCRLRSTWMLAHRCVPGLPEDTLNPTLWLGSGILMSSPGDWGVPLWGPLTQEPRRG